MNAADIIKELKSMGNATYRATMQRHGAGDNYIGVKIEDMKKIQKRVKSDYRLALDLYDTGIGDAMYLAGLIADDAKMSKKDLNRWVEHASFPMIREYTVPWVAAGSPHGWELALEWIDSKDENIASTGWSTLSSILSITDDAKLDIASLKKLLKRVQDSIHGQRNRVKYVMNGFVIAAGGYVAELTSLALQTAAKIGKVTVDMGDTDCRVPDAVEYIKKMQARGAIGKKRKSAKC